jgi:hypothetical protein
MPKSLNSSASLTSLTSSIPCVRNSKTKRCRKSFKKDETSKYCNYNNHTTRCRTIKNTKVGVTISILNTNYLVSSYVNKWLHSTKNTSKILKGVKDKDLKDHVILEILERAKVNVANDPYRTGNVIEMKEIREVIKEDGDRLRKLQDFLLK